MPTDSPVILYCSFSNLLDQVVRGRLGLDDLRAPKSRIIVNCDRRHVLGCPPGRVPWEVGRGARPELVPDDLGNVNADECPPHNLHVFRQLQEVLEEKDRRGHLLCRCGNYPALRDAAVAAGLDVFWCQMHRGDPEGQPPSQTENADLAWAISTL